MVSGYKIFSFAVIALIACSVFLSFPQTGNAQYICCQITPISCADNSGSGGGVACDSQQNVVPDAFCNDSDGLCTSLARNVPTLSEWGLIALAGVMGLVGFILLRRRNATA